jgi:hypothetical protein
MTSAKKGGEGHSAGLNKAKSACDGLFFPSAIRLGCDVDPLFCDGQNF